MRRFGVALFLLIVILAALISLLPMNKLLEQQIKQRMALAGLPAAEFTLESVSLSRAVVRDLALKEPEISADKLTIDYSQSGGAFKGSWALEGLVPPASFLAVPPLAGKGAWSYENGTASLEGGVFSKDDQYRMNWMLSGQQLVIRGVSLPWQGGHLKSDLIQINLASSQPVSFVLQVEKVPLERLLEMLASGKALATGVVSGALPLTMDGKKITIASGQLKTLEKGVVKIAPEVIPATNEQMTMLRDVLSNFHYQEFSLALDSQQHDQLSIVLALRGRNPDLYDGREVKMNVNFSGDVLQLIEHSVMTSINPDLLLERK